MKSQVINMSDKTYSSTEHYRIEKQINELIINQRYDEAVELIKDNSEIFEFKAEITDTPPVYK